MTVSRSCSTREHTFSSRQSNRIFMLTSLIFLVFSTPCGRGYFLLFHRFPGNQRGARRIHRYVEAEKSAEKSWPNVNDTCCGLTLTYTIATEEIPMAYELPPLPYDYSALEPFIDTETMKLHHDKPYLTSLHQQRQRCFGQPSRSGRAFCG